MLQVTISKCEEIICGLEMSQYFSIFSLRSLWTVSGGFRTSTISSKHSHLWNGHQLHTTVVKMRMSLTWFSQYRNQYLLLKDFPKSSGLMLEQEIVLCRKGNIIPNLSPGLFSSPFYYLFLQKRISGRKWMWSNRNLFGKYEEIEKISQLEPERWR